MNIASFPLPTVAVHLGKQLWGVLADQRLDNGNVTGVRGSEVHRAPLRVLLAHQQHVGLATEFDEGGNVAVLQCSVALAQQGHDCGALLVVLEGALVGIVQRPRVLASQQLDGGSVGAVQVVDLVQTVTTAYERRDFPALIRICGTSDALKALVSLCECGSWEAVSKRIETIPNQATIEEMHEKGEEGRIAFATAVLGGAPVELLLVNFV